MDELKPCPFCGGNAMIIANRHRHDQTTFYVKCNNINCGVIPETYEVNSINYAIEIWNGRANNGKEE